jgi:hypothetical protein
MSGTPRTRSRPLMAPEQPLSVGSGRCSGTARSNHHRREDRTCARANPPDSRCTRHKHSPLPLLMICAFTYNRPGERRKASCAWSMRSEASLPNHRVPIPPCRSAPSSLRLRRGSTKVRRCHAWLRFLQSAGWKPSTATRTVTQHNRHNQSVRWTGEARPGLRLFTFGTGPHFQGSKGGLHLNQPIVGMALG